MLGSIPAGSTMVRIFRKEGWKLNSNDNVVNSIIRRIEINEGECPCHNDSVDKHCPCTSYKEDNKCHCSLYVPEEVWEPIKGFEGDYEVSNFGKVRSLKRNKLLRQFEYRGGYLEVHLRKPGMKIHKKVHRLVAEHFLDNPNNYKEVNHKDENKKNNVFTNLEWCNHSYNNTYNNKSRKVGVLLRKPVFQYDLEGNFIKRYNSQSEAALETEIKQGGIADCLRGHSKTSGGFIWRFS